jgi:hypothetical protein
LVVVEAANDEVKSSPDLKPESESEPRQRLITLKMLHQQHDRHFD